MLYFYGVVVEDFEDAMVGSCTKKTTMSSSAQAVLLLSRMSEREICQWEEMAHNCSLDSGSYCTRPDVMGCEEWVGRDGLSFDSEEGVVGSEDQMAGKEEEAAVRQPIGSDYGSSGRALLGGRDGGGAVDMAGQREASKMVEKR
ncbi:hypothetical protein B296_00006129 [Ensete ventricosum]|uniref:Uncharacterized protein n=1 Tax=Ensete ventricosum TaxID=4639 RepID=A0A427ABW0_ENSVE|nr:hypothetical protein B296_00006129 [Ensete ventricosum]